MMKNTPNLYDTLIHMLDQHGHWLDQRHLYTFVWMIVGLIESKTIRLPEWAPFVDSRATFAQSTVRRFSRWLNNQRIKIHELYGPIIQEALAAWDDHTIYLFGLGYIHAVGSLLSHSYLCDLSWSCHSSDLENYRAWQ